MSRWTLLLTLAATLGPVPQPVTAQEAEPDPSTIRAATRTLESDLRNLVTAQEMYFAEHKTYAPSLRAMRSIYRPSRTVTLVMLTASGTGHSGIAIDERAPDLVCAMFVGDAPPPLGRGEEGDPICRGP